MWTAVFHRIPDGEEMEGERNPFSRQASGAILCRTGRIPQRYGWVRMEIDAILERTFYANSRDKSARKGYPGKSRGKQECCSLQRPGDPYLPEAGRPDRNIFWWTAIILFLPGRELRKLAQDNMDGARGRLMDLLCNYQAIRKCCLMVVLTPTGWRGHATEGF